MIEIERQILVGAHIGAEDLGDHLLVGRPVQHVALVPILDAQHLLAVVVVAPALAPQVGRLDGRHQQFDGAGAVLLLAHDPADLVEHPQAERQERIDAGGLLPDHARPQHQPMGHDLRLLGRFAQDRAGNNGTGAWLTARFEGNLGGRQCGSWAAKHKTARATFSCPLISWDAAHGVVQRTTTCDDSAHALL